MKKRRLSLCLAMLIMLTALTGAFQMKVLAAQGKIYLSMSQSDIKVGDTVKVTASAVDDGNNGVTATMKINFDMELFSFVSCSESSYQGGDGGTLTTTGSTVSVTLKAQKSGSGGISVSGSNATTSGGSSLEGVTGASTAVSVGSSSGNTDTSNESSSDNTEDSTQDNANKSSDNSLSSLKISAGTLSPEFKYSTTQYTASVGADVNEITVDAKTSNANAKIESIEGNKDLKAGENTIKIHVKAENNATVVYTIVVTKGSTGETGQTDGNTDSQEETPDSEGNTETDGENAQNTGDGTILIGGISYTVENEFSSEDIPEDFAEAFVSYMGQEVKAARFNNGHITLLYLKSDSEGAKNGFYVYNEAQNIFQPYIRISFGEKYIIVLYPSLSAEVPDGYTQSELTVLDKNGVIGYKYGDNPASTEENGGETPTDEQDEGSPDSSFLGNYQPMTVQASDVQESEDTPEETDQSTFGEPQSADISDFYLLYAMNNEGVEGWYQYDSKDGTVQRFVETVVEEQVNSETVRNVQKAMNDLDKQYKEEKASLRKWNIIFIIVIVLLIIVIVNIFLFSKKKPKEEYYDGEEETIFNVKTVVKEKRREEEPKPVNEPKVFQKQEKMQETKKIPVVKTDKNLSQEEAKENSFDNFSVNVHNKEEKISKPVQKDSDWVKDFEIKVPKIEEDLEVMDLNDL